MKMMKRIIGILIALGFASAAGYLVGYVNGVEESLLYKNVLSATEAKYSLDRMEEWNGENSENVKTLIVNRRTASIDATRDILSWKSGIANYPKRLFTYWSMFPSDLVERARRLSAEIQE